MSPRGEAGLPGPLPRRIAIWVWEEGASRRGHGRRGTDAPLKSAIMPNGGLRMVESGLSEYGYATQIRDREELAEQVRAQN